jgi:hypothetical protein
MTNHNQVRRSLRTTALSAALLLTPVPAALADPADLGLSPATGYVVNVASINRDTHRDQTAIKDPANAQAAPWMPEDAFNGGAR